MKNFVLTLTILVLSVGAKAQIWDNVGPLGFSGINSGTPTMEIDASDNIYVAYTDVLNGNQANVQMYNGTAWSQLGSLNFSPGSAFSLVLKLDNNDVPYVAYTDGANMNKASVMMYNGTTWVNVGAAGFTTGSAEEIDLVFDSSNAPWISFRDGNEGGKASVFRFGGVIWQQVGFTGFSDGQVYQTSIELNSFDLPVVAYRDVFNSNELSVVEFDGSQYNYVGGTAGITTSYVGYPDVFIDTNDDIYVAYMDGSVSQWATVQKYDGSSWSTVGYQGFSLGSIFDIDVCINQGTIYASYRSQNNPEVRYYDPVNVEWKLLGGEQISSGIGDNPNMAFDSQDKIHVVYRDGDNGNATTVKWLCGFQTDSVSAPCNPVLSPSGTTYYTVDGNYSDTLSNQYGCDSIINLTLWFQLMDVTVTTPNQNICDGWTTTLTANLPGGVNFEWDGGAFVGQDYDVSPSVTTTYEVIGSNSSGCIDTAEITVFVADLSNFDLLNTDTVLCAWDSLQFIATGAHSYYFQQFGNTPDSTVMIAPTSTGYYYVDGYDSTGFCSVYDSIHITVNQPPTWSGGIYGGVITINDPFPGYEWYFNGNLIPGADSSSYPANQNGDYTCIVTDSSGCTNSQTWNVAGIGWNELSQELKVYPNPFTNEINFYATEFESLTIKDLSGRILYQFGSMNGPVTLDLSDLSTGTYLLQAEKNGSMLTKIIIRQ